MHAACSWERGARATGACAAAVVAAPLRRKPRRPASWFIRCLRSPTTSTLTSPMQLPQSFEVTWPHLPSPRYTPNLTRILDGGPRTSFPSPPGTSGVPGSAPLPWRPYTTWLAHFGRLVGRGALVSAFAEFTVLERGDPAGSVMDTKKKVHAYVRVKPTDDFAHEMITFGDDGKVSGRCLPPPAWASPCPASTVGPCFQIVAKDRDRIGEKFRWTLEPIRSKPLSHDAVNEEIH